MGGPLKVPRPMGQPVAGVKPLVAAITQQGVSRLTMSDYQRASDCQTRTTGRGQRGRMMDFIGTIAIATKAIEGLKLLRGLEKTFDEASFKMQIADITSKVADLKTALVEANSEAAEKDAKTSSLSKPKKLSRKKVLHTSRIVRAGLKACHFAHVAKLSMDA
jgi:hypothetical protein